MNAKPRQKKHIVYLTASLMLLAASIVFFGRLKPLVETSYRASSAETLNPDTLLNHANTYYWWGRYRKNTLPEFDTAAAWAGKALQLAQAQFEADKDTATFLTRKRQAEQLIALAQEQAAICKYNIASYIPTYMEVMGYDDDYMHEDADPEDVPNVALRGALNRLMDLLSPDRAQTIATRTSFALVNVNTSNPMAEEMLVQELNNKTRMYTIAPHELARIAGKDSISVSMLVSDSSLMKKVAAAFNTDELAVIDFTENDKVNGIYYYGIRLKLWNTDKGWNSRNTYTEYMVRDRVFNQVTVFIGRLLFVVLLLALAINFILLSLAGWFQCIKPVTPYYLLLCCIISLLTQYLLVTFGLKNFLNPAPDAYFVSDPGEQWTFAYPLTFILPGFITYLILGKMDNFISSFRSDFENQTALFSMVSGSLLPVAFSFTYFQVLRFGFGPSAYALFTIVLIVICIAFAVSRYWSAIIHFPQKIHMAVRLTTWVAFVGHILIAFLFISSLLQNYDNLNIVSWFLTSFLIPAAILESLCRLTAYAVRKGRPAAKHPFPEDEQPEDIQNITFEHEAVIEKGKKYASLYVRSQRGATGRTAVESYLQNKLDPEEYLVVDFAIETKGIDVHYLPFAKAFEEKLSYNKFNDVAETARKTSNIIGKALSAITSAAGILIDDGQTKPRNPDELAELLLKKLDQKKCLLLLDHIDKIDEENIRLLEALVNKIIEHRQEIASSIREPHQLPVLIACGTGEYGYRDKVLSVLGRLRRDGMEKGVLEFELKFSNAVENYLSKKPLPVQVELHLQDLFIREHRDYSPEVVRQSFEALEKNEVLKLTPTPINGVSMLMMSLTGFEKLPEIRVGRDLDAEVHQHSELKDMLIAAAYLADAEGKFHLPVLAHALKIDRIPLLHLLKEAERYNLVYDLKGKEHFYWYAFTDRSLVDDFKEVENPRQELVSQLANEYYRGYVEYFCPHTSVEANMLHLHELTDTGKLDADNLFLLAQRAAAVEQAFPSLAFSIHHLTARYIGSNSVAYFDEALVVVKRAFEIFNTLNDSDKRSSSVKIFELRQLKFKLLIETGEFKNPVNRIDDLYDKITGDDQYEQQDEALKQELICWKIRLCFTRFNKEKKDAESGQQLCTKLLQTDGIDTILRWRLNFYQLKLVPSVELIFGKKEFNEEEVIRVNRAYRNLIAEIESSLKIENHSGLKDLYREILNDYAGSFLSDKLLSLFDPEQNKISEKRVEFVLVYLGIKNADQLFATIKSYLLKRIRLELHGMLTEKELENENKVFDDRELRKLLENNDKAIDKRGLCYTLNYYSRACRTMRMEEEALRFSILSFDFNSQVGDKTGACLAAGTAGYAYMYLNNPAKAFEWFRISFGVGWSITHFSRFSMVMHMLLMAERMQRKKDVCEAEFYAWQLLQLKNLSLLGKENLTEEIALLLLKSKEELSKSAGTNLLSAPYASLGVNHEVFIENLRAIVRVGSYPDSKFDITSENLNDLTSGILQGMKFTIKEKNCEDYLIISAARLKGNGNWYINSIDKGPIKTS